MASRTRTTPVLALLNSCLTGYFSNMFSMLLLWPRTFLAQLSLTVVKQLPILVLIVKANIASPSSRVKDRYR